jgi:hypothetical protein
MNENLNKIFNAFMKDEGMFIGWKEGWNKDLTRS